MISVRDYYLNLEEACFEYSEYQAAWLATKLCQLSSTKKQFSDWKKLSRSQELLDYYNKKNSPDLGYKSCPENSQINLR